MTGALKHAAPRADHPGSPMKVQPTQNGDAAAPRIADTRIENADPSAFKTVLAQASTDRARAPTSPPTIPPTSLRKGEKMEPVEDHKYAEITAGKRSGMFINTSGNVRDGEAFVLVRKNGKEYHIYGTGKDRLVVGFHMPETTHARDRRDRHRRCRRDVKPTAGETTGLHLRKGEKIEPVEGHAYAEIVSGARNGMFVNTSGNERHGETFVLVHKHGVEYHIYGSGANREVVAMKPRNRDDDDASPVRVRARRSAPPPARAGSSPGRPAHRPPPAAPTPGRG